MGNKIDRDDHEIPGDIGEDFANRHGMYFLQTSAKNCDNVDRLFTEIAHELLQQVTQKYFSSSPPLERDTGFSSEKIHNVIDVDQYQAKQNDKISMRKAVKCNVINNFSALELNISLPTLNVCNYCYFQAKAKDLPSESHSVQNISDSTLGQSSSVKSNCCSKVL